VKLARVLWIAPALLAPGFDSARAQEVDGASPAAWRISIAPTVAALALDPHLADYRWDTSVSARPGLQAGVHRGRVAAALRTSWSGTEQSIATIGASSSAAVHMTQLDLALEGRIAALAGIQVWGSAHGGRLFLGYEPDEMTIDAGGVPLTVSFEPITEWCYGLGIAFRRDVARHLALGLQLDRTAFRLDTAHRRGDEIVTSRENFSNWSLAVALTGFMDL
jgi:hypothetical protein